MSDKQTSRGDPWRERKAGVFMGRGRLELLERIREHGSISAAARATGLSYKAAWDAVNALNNLFPEPLVLRSTGGAHGGGTALTDYGHRVVTLFRTMEHEYQDLLEQLSRQHGDFPSFYQLTRRLTMKTSARNQLHGKVSALTKGAVNAEVVLDLDQQDQLVAIITNDSVDRLGLGVGSEAYALVKASSVIVAPDDGRRTSARNHLCGTVTRCQEGAVNGEVVIELAGGKTLTAIITNESIRNLGLKSGDRACALVKASSVILAVAD